MSKTTHRINAFIRSELATLLVLVAALFAQMPHAARVFRGLSDDGVWHSWLFAIALELAVLMFAVRGRVGISWGAAGVSVAMNLSYYALQGDRLFVLSAFPIWLVSISLPVAIALYSHNAAHDAAEQPTQAKPTTMTTVTEKPRKTAQDKPQAKRGKSPSVQERITAMMQRGDDVDVKALAKQWGKSESTIRSAMSRAKQQPEPSMNGTAP